MRSGIGYNVAIFDVLTDGDENLLFVFKLAFEFLCDE